MSSNASSAINCVWSVYSVLQFLTCKMGEILLPTPGTMKKFSYDTNTTISTTPYPFDF